MRGDPFDFEFDPSQMEDQPTSTVTTFSLKDEQKVELEINADAGNAESAFRLYLYFAFAVRDDRKSEEWLLRSAEMDHSTAQYTLAESLFRKGMYEEAKFWCKKSMDNGNQMAKQLWGKIEKQ